MLALCELRPGGRGRSSLVRNPETVEIERLKVAVLSDVHSAAEHYREALCAARAEGFDRLVILGDLFTYGPDPVEVLQLTTRAIELDAALLVRGNHDELYLGGAYVPEGAASWVTETVNWTRESLAARADDIAGLPWVEEAELGGVLFAHANPFGYGDWTYLRDDLSMNAACHALRKRGFRAGVFGHVHRFRRHCAAGAQAITVGSVGQPRDRSSPIGEWAVVTAGTGKLEVERRPIALDWAPMIERIRSTTLSEHTKDRLCQFYRP